MWSSKRKTIIDLKSNVLFLHWGRVKPIVLQICNAMLLLLPSWPEHIYPVKQLMSPLQNKQTKKKNRKKGKKERKIENSIIIISDLVKGSIISFGSVLDNFQSTYPYGQKNIGCRLYSWSDMYVINIKKVSILFTFWEDLEEGLL